MIIHTSDSHQIPSQNNTKSYLQNLQNCQKFKFLIVRQTLHETHLLELLDKMYRYEVDPTRTVSATERIRDAGRTGGHTNGRIDGRTEWNQYTSKRGSKGRHIPTDSDIQKPVWTSFLYILNNMLINIAVKGAKLL